MRINKTILTLLVGLGLLAAVPACRSGVEVRQVFDIEAFADGHPMQAFAIRADTVFVLYDGGLCRTWSLRDRNPAGEYFLESAHATLHCGNADFAPDGLLYVSGDLTTRACYVESVSATGSARVQTITFDLDNGFGGSQVVLDRERGRMVYMQRELRNIAATDNVFHIYEFGIPDTAAGDVTLTLDDALAHYTLDRYEPIYQGASIRGGMLLLGHGICPDEDGHKVGLAAYSIPDGRFLGETDLTPLISLEPQAVHLYKGRLYDNFNGRGLCEVSTKELSLKKKQK